MCALRKDAASICATGSQFLRVFDSCMHRCTIWSLRFPPLPPPPTHLNRSRGRQHLLLRASFRPLLQRVRIHTATGDLSYSWHNDTLSLERLDRETLIVVGRASLSAACCRRIRCHRRRWRTRRLCRRHQGWAAGLEGGFREICAEEDAVHNLHARGRGGSLTELTGSSSCLLGEGSWGDQLFLR